MLFLIFVFPSFISHFLLYKLSFLYCITHSSAGALTVLGFDTLSLSGKMNWEMDLFGVSKKIAMTSRMEQNDRHEESVSQSLHEYYLSELLYLLMGLRDTSSGMNGWSRENRLTVSWLPRFVIIVIDCCSLTSLNFKYFVDGKSPRRINDIIIRRRYTGPLSFCSGWFWSIIPVSSLVYSFRIGVFVLFY